MRARPPRTSASAIERPKAGLQYDDVTWPIMVIGIGSRGSATICAPSSSTILGSVVSRPTSCFRSARVIAGRTRDRFPTKSFLALPTAQESPTSSGVTVPSVS